MTTQDFIKKLDNQYEKIADAKFLLLPVTEVHARQVKRIFERGIGGDGSKIGSYNSTDPIYVDPDKSPKGFPLKGKSGETTFKNGKKHKTGYFDSYKAFRNVIGRESSFVNLRLTNNLNFDFVNSLELDGRYYVTGVKRKENSDKVDGLRKKYGEETFKLTLEEKELFVKAVEKRIDDTLNN
jgi:hypothetical protein